MRWLRSSPLLAALLVGDPGCEEASPGASPQAASASPQAASASPRGEASLAPGEGARVDYRLSWDWQGAEEEGGARVLETSLGYRVRIESLYTGTISMELVPCGVAGARRRGFVREAAADHDYKHDSTLLSRALAESAFEPGALAFGEARASGATYCHLHLLSGPVAESASDGFRLQAWSLYFKGSYARNGEAPAPIEAFVNLGRGAMRRLVAPVDLVAPASPRVTVTRRVADALDPVDFGALEPIDLAFEILERLGTTSVASVEAG